MLPCLGRAQPGTLPYNINNNNHNTAAVCGAPWQQLLQGSLARSFWKGVGDIKEVLVPNTGNNINTSTFYVNNEENILSEEDNFFEDMTALYRQQVVLFQRCCEQIKDVYRVDIAPTNDQQQVSPFGKTIFSYTVQSLIYLFQERCLRMVVRDYTVMFSTVSYTC